MFNKESIQLVEESLPKLLTSAKSLQDVLHPRKELIDRYLQKTGDYSKGTLSGELVTQMGDKSKIRNVEVPVAFIAKETAHAYMAGTFLTGYPIFAAVSNRENEQGASMLTALVGRDQQRMQWVPELLRCFDDVIRYNICATEVLWKVKRSTSVKTAVKAGSATTGTARAIIYEGNSLMRIDPYNLIYDTLVEPHKVHSDGNFVGYVELKSYISVKTLYLELNDVFTIKSNIKKIFSGEKCSQYVNMYRKPVVRKSIDGARNGQDFTNFWGNSPKIEMSANATGLYEVTTLYRRLIPREFKIEVPGDGQPQVFKLIYINGYLAYAEPVVSGHEYLPIVIGQFYPGDQDVKSFVEFITDMQDLSTGLMTATLDSMRRAVGDRAIYDPVRIRKADIESPSPVSKIPVSMNGYQNGLEAAYKAIPYVDNISGNFQAMMGTVQALADKSVGLNGVTQGSFVPGNKTMSEFQTVMAGSQARLQLGATNLDGNFINPIKEILKINYLIFANAGAIEDQQTGTTVTIDPDLLRKTAPEFKMADGLMPATKQANTEVLMQALVTIQNNPQLSLEYDVGGLVVSILRQQGFTNLHEYKRTPEQMQMYLNQLQAQTIAQTPPEPKTEEPSQ